MNKIDKSLNIDYKKFHLPNGIKCVLYNRPEIHSVSIQVTVNVGALDEKKEENGLSHFIEHVAAGDGTKGLPSWEALERYKNEYSGDANAYTTFDHTKYYGTFPYQYLEQALYFFSQQVFHPLLKASDVEKERTIILDECRRYEDDTYFQLYKDVRNIRFTTTDTQYSSQIIGTKENLEKFDQSDIKRFYKKYYNPENIEVYIVGNFDQDNMQKLLEKFFYKEIEQQKSTKKASREFKKSYPDYSGTRISAVRKRDIDQYYISLNFPAPEFSLTTAEERYKTTFLCNLAASGQYSQSVLWKRLREELNLVYGISASTMSFLYTRNIFNINTSFKKDNLSTVLSEIYKGLNLIKSGKITDEVFKARKKRLLDTQLMQLDSPGNILGWIIDREDEIEEHGHGLSLAEYIEYVQNEKFQNIINHSEKIFDWNKVNISIVSQDEQNEVQDKVEKMWKKITTK